MFAIAEQLRMLRDVQGVHGSFAVSRSGALVDRDLPEIFDDELLSLVGPRVVHLHEALAGSRVEMDACMLRYAEHKLYLRNMSWGLVAVLLAANANLPALRMVLNLMIRRNDSEGTGHFVRPSPSRLPPPPPRATIGTPVDSGAPRHVRMYRGRPVSE